MLCVVHDSWQCFYQAFEANTIGKLHPWLAAVRNTLGVYLWQVVVNVNDGRCEIAMVLLRRLPADSGTPPVRSECNCHYAFNSIGDGRNGVVGSA